ncbi:hypothetical protein [Vallitalea okinawensis]|uniref:hypothetical protein n=1 Tax=Vallitalea okinawensis TaxID=2078660 RepID=UPI000CFCAD8F|nr:hypothetical protein [Vallitalea okinawensis]
MTLYDYFFMMVLITFLILFIRYGVLFRKYGKSLCVVGEHERIAFTFVLGLAVVMTIFSILTIMEEGFYHARDILLLLLLYYLLVIYLHTVSKVYFTEKGIFTNNKIYQFKDILYIKEIRENDEEIEYEMIIRPKKYKKFIRFSISINDSDRFNTFMIKMKNRKFKNNGQLDI